MVKSPAVLSGFLTAFLIYSGIVTVCPRHALRSLVPEKNITRISGFIASSPAKSSTGSSYSMLVELTEASSFRFTGNASGRIRLFVPSSNVEALLPKRLYSSAKEGDASLYETGALITADVSYIESRNDSPVPCTVEPDQYYAQTVRFTGWRTEADYIRALLRLQLKRILSAWSEAGGLLLALICGAREYTGQDVSDAFRGAGLSHILALSGMHLSLFSSLAERTVGKALGKKLQPLLTISVSVLFVWFAGVSPSLMRALICMFITAWASVCGIQVSVLEKVACSFLVHVCIFPEDAGSAAFMLSYGALIGLYFGDTYIKPVISGILPPAASSSVSASIGAQLMTAPVSIILFGECRPGGIIASVIVSPLASWFVTGGIFGLCGVLVIPFLLRPVGVIMNYLYTLIRYLVTLFARIPGICVT